MSKFKNSMKAIACAGILVMPLTSQATIYTSYVSGYSDTGLADYFNAATSTLTKSYEGFETLPPGSPSLSLSLFGGKATATAAGTITDTSTGDAGRSAHGGNYFWELGENGAVQITISFTTTLAAFGFYVSDLGDFGGSLSVSENNSYLSTATGSAGSGSIGFFGIWSDNSLHDFNSVQLSLQLADGCTAGADCFDLIGLDDLVMGVRGSQECEADCNRVPEPGSSALLGLGLAGLAASRRRKHK